MVLDGPFDGESLKADGANVGAKLKLGRTLGTSVPVGFAVNVGLKLVDGDTVGLDVVGALLGMSDGSLDGAPLNIDGGTEGERLKLGGVLGLLEGASLSESVPLG